MVTALALLAVACGGESDTAARTTSPTSASATTELATTTTSTSVPDQRAFAESGAPKALLGDGGGDDAQGAGSTGSGTAIPASGVSGSGTAGYTGFLGTIGIDDRLYGAPAPAPVAQPGTAPLTGLPGNVPRRPAVVVKVDNSSRARPQVGLHAADIVFEEQVEGGLTRLAAVFHSRMTAVGPVRSGRTTDISFINAFGGPALVYSGANRIIDTLLLNQTTVHNYAASRSGGFYRDNSRRFPSNLFTDTSKFTGLGGPPPAQFAYGTPAGGTPASSLSISFPGVNASWSWEGSQWLRRQGGSAHVSDGAQLGAANVVVVVVPEIQTGMVDTAGSLVPEYVFAGSGAASVFTAGQRIDGRWTRPTLRSPAILTTAGGEVIELTPGATWVELVTAGSYSSS